MKTPFSRTRATLVLCSCMIFLVSMLSNAQEDTVEFKFIPKYYPNDDPKFVPLPRPEIVHSPKIIYPSDPSLQDREADVWVKVLVNREGIVREAEVFKTTDEAFNEHAIKYAMQYKFKWSQEWPEDLKDRKTVWISIPINFRQ